MKKQMMAILFGATLILGACGGEDTTEPEQAPDESGGETTAIDAEQVVQQNCISCHGENLEGAGNFPSLNDVGSRLSQDEIRTVIENGRGAMPAGIIEGDEADAVAEYLANMK